MLNTTEFRTLNNHIFRPRTPDGRTIVRCPVGHSYFGSTSSSTCPFCEDFLSEFRKLALDRNAELITLSQSKYLKFNCKKHKEPFVLTPNEARKGDRWCPACREQQRGFRDRSPKPRDLPKRIVDPAKEQAHLLDSARLKYTKGFKREKVDISKLYIEARKYLEIQMPIKQIVVVLAAGSGDLSGESYWSQLCEALDSDTHASLSSVEQIYRSAAKQVHPDKCRHPLADEAFKKLAAEFRKASSKFKNIKD